MTFDKVETDILEWRRHVWMGSAVRRGSLADFDHYKNLTHEELYRWSTVAEELIADYREGDRVER